MICKKLAGARDRQKPFESFFAALNNDFSAQDWFTELKPVRLELSGREDSDYVKKIYSMSVNKMATQNI
jgi:hypothetical protein